MDNNSKNLSQENSCLMMAMSLETPVDLGYLFDTEDLQGTKIEFETHVTLLYAPGVVIPKEGMLDDIESLIGPREFDVMINKLRNAAELPKGWFGSIWELGSFSNDSDYLVLKLTNVDNPYASWLRDTFGVINKGLKRKWGITSEYPYTPHITLAELKPGTVGKYLEDSKIKKVLSDSILSFSDLVLSIGPSGGDMGGGKDRKQYNLTSYNAVNRYFQQETLRKEFLEMLREEGIEE